MKVTFNLLSILLLTLLVSCGSSGKQYSIVFFRSFERAKPYQYNIQYEVRTDTYKQGRKISNIRRSLDAIFDIQYTDSISGEEWSEGLVVIKKVNFILEGEQTTLSITNTPITIVMSQESVSFARVDNIPLNAIETEALRLMFRKKDLHPTDEAVGTEKLVL